MNPTIAIASLVSVCSVSSPVRAELLTYTFSGSVSKSSITSGAWSATRIGDAFSIRWTVDDAVPPTTIAGSYSTYGLASVRAAELTIGAVSIDLFAQGLADATTATTILDNSEQSSFVSADGFTTSIGTNAIVVGMNWMYLVSPVQNLPYIDGVEWPAQNELNSMSAALPIRWSVGVIGSSAEELVAMIDVATVVPSGASSAIVATLAFASGARRRAR